MAPEVFDQAVGEDQVEILTAEELVGAESVTLDRGDTRAILSSLVEIHDRYVPRHDRRPRPPHGGSAQIHHTEFRQARNVAEYHPPTSAPHPLCQRIVPADQQRSDGHLALPLPASACQPVCSGGDRTCRH